VRTESVRTKRRPLRTLARLTGAATAAVVAWSTTAGAATTARPGSQPTQLVSHVTPGARDALSGQVVNGAEVMAAVVGAMAVLALAFLVITFIRRRAAVA